MSGTGFSIDDDSKFGITALIRNFINTQINLWLIIYYLLLLSGEVIQEGNAGGRGYCSTSGEKSEFVEIFVSGLGVGIIIILCLTTIL